MMMAAAAGGGEGGEAAEEQTEFDVVLTGFGDKKLNVVKVVKNLDRLDADGSQEVGRERSGRDQGKGLQGRGREGQGRIGRSWRVGRTQVTPRIPELATPARRLRCRAGAG